MFVTNNHDFFHLWGKKNLVKHQKVSKCYDQDCLKNFLLHFMSSLRAPIFENSNFVIEICLIFLKTSRIKLQMLSIPNLDLSEKIAKVGMK